MKTGGIERAGERPTVMVSGVGGGVGQSIVKSLQGSRYRVVGVDGEPLAAGLHAVDRGYRVPYAASPGYVERLLEICGREGCAMIFPGLDAELPVLSRAAAAFRERGVTPVVSAPEVVETCDDKLATCEFLAGHGFPAPLTRPLTPETARMLPLPVVLKPRRGGARSRGVFVVTSEAELSYRLSTVELANYVVQEHLEGDEYTCGSVSVGGRCHGAILMRRILRDGDTYKAFVVSDRRLEQHVRDVAEALRPFGACNFQLRLKGAEPYVFEINARCSGTTYSRALAGFNEPLMIADHLSLGRAPAYQTREISILRYWKELAVENRRIAELAESGALEGDGTRL